MSSLSGNVKEEILSILFLVVLLGSFFLSVLGPIMLLWFILEPLDFYQKLLTIFIGSILSIPVTILTFAIWDVILS